MCGIAGIVADRVDERDVDLMLAMISHRGPDEFGTYTDDAIGLGTARLSIIDIDHGQQPMRDAASGVVIVYNGEVFNYRELRDEALGPDWPLRTLSDTEVVLQLYLKYGESFVTRLNGQYAIAIWDPRVQRLLLTRDRFGICPLFFHQNGGRLCFASEVKALFTLPWVPKRIDPRCIDQVFSLWAPLAGTSAFEDVQEVRPGHMLVYCRETGLRSAPYWDWAFPSLHSPSPLAFGPAKEALREALKKAVSLRLRADIEVGSYLSGGIDSSALVSLGAELRPGGLRTFSIAFGDDSYDESPYQDMVSAHCGTTHRRFQCDYDAIAGRFAEAVWHAEVPLFRTAPTPLTLLAESVRRAGIKVVLTGEGADEILLGYDLFRELKIRRFWQRQPESAWRPLLLKRLYAYLPQFSNPRYVNLAIQSYRPTLDVESPAYSHVMRWMNNAANKIYFSPELKAALGEYDCVEELCASLPENYHRAADVDRAQYLELTTLLRGYLLSSQGDRMIMAQSVESRFPFLDHEFVSVANALPAAYKAPGLKDKHILREAFRGRLPDEICDRPKFAYQAPEIRAFFAPGAEQSGLVDEHLAEARLRETGFYDARPVAGLLRKIRASRLQRMGTRDNMAFVQILSTQLLQRLFVETDLRRDAERRLERLTFKTRIRRKRDSYDTSRRDRRWTA